MAGEVLPTPLRETALPLQEAAAVGTPGPGFRPRLSAPPKTSQSVPAVLRVPVRRLRLRAVPADPLRLALTSPPRGVREGSPQDPVRLRPTPEVSLQPGGLEAAQLQTWWLRLDPLERGVFASMVTSARTVPGALRPEVVAVPLQVATVPVPGPTVRPQEEVLLEESMPTVALAPTAVLVVAVK